MLKILAILSYRSLRSHRVSTLIVGSIVFFGAFVLVSGTAMLSSLEGALSNSVISSVAGHLQAYSSEGRDALALFGSGFAAVDDVGQMPNFARVRDVLLEDDNVRAAIPMGMQMHAMSTSPELDRLLARLGSALAAGDDEETQALGVQIRSIAADVIEEAGVRASIAADGGALQARLDSVRQVQSAAFWEGLARNPGPGLQLLDTQLAPLCGSPAALTLRDLGTDLTAFARTFDRFEVVDGSMVPAGRRGFLFAKQVYERWLKHPAARTFDVLHEGLADKSRTLAHDPALRERAERLPEQARPIATALRPAQAHELEGALTSFLAAPARPLRDLLEQFFQVDDQNFAARHDFFYRTIAPRLRLYAVALGEDMTLQSVTHGGYTKSVKVRLWGTYRFLGLEKSAVAGVTNLMDLVTFRELYGAPDVAVDEELQSLRQSVAVAAIDRDDAEAQMFGDTHVHAERLVAAAPDDAVAPQTLHALNEARKQAQSDHFDVRRLDDGLALNAAVWLKDPSTLQPTLRRLNDLVQRAGLAVQLVDWRTASGMVSRFVSMVHLFLYVATAAIFLVALVIMSNAMTMATAERTREIGTIRAMGGQRGFILLMYFCETLTLGIVAGAAGALAALVGVAVTRIRGIPAASDVMVFLFSGPRLYPSIAPLHALFGMLVVLLVTLASTLYPARVATRIAPVVAMQSKE